MGRKCYRYRTGILPLLAALFVFAVGSLVFIALFSGPTALTSAISERRITTSFLGLIAILTSWFLVVFWNERVEVDDTHIYHYNWRGVNDVTILKADIVEYRDISNEGGAMRQIRTAKAKITVRISEMNDAEEFQKMMEDALAESSIRSRGYVFRKERGQ